MKAIDYLYKNLKCFNPAIFKQFLEEEGVESQDLMGYLRNTIHNTNPVILRDFGMDIVRTVESDIVLDFTLDDFTVEATTEQSGDFYLNPGCGCDGLMVPVGLEKDSETAESHVVVTEIFIGEEVIDNPDLIHYIVDELFTDSNKEIIAQKIEEAQGPTE